jgi:drug/metabolite transporter (DMT)-like permease
MIKRLTNLLIGVFLTIFGVVFIYLCISNIQRMGWDIINPEAQIKTLRHPDGEDLSQLILSTMCALGGIVGGIYYIVLSFMKEKEEEQ